MELLDFAISAALDIHHLGFISTWELGSGGITDFSDKCWFRIAGVRSARNNGELPCWSEILVPEQFSASREDIPRTNRSMYDHLMQEHELNLDHVEQDITATALLRSLTVLLG